MAVECLRSKFGYCRLGNLCKNIHFSICEKISCAGTKCEKRHPVPCFYYNRFARCKFGEFCAYRHNKTKEQVLEEELETLRNEFNDMKKEIDELFDKMSKLKQAHYFNCLRRRKFQFEY